MTRISMPWAAVPAAPAAACLAALMLAGCAGTAPRAPGERPVPAPEAPPPAAAPAPALLPDTGLPAPSASANSLVNGHGPLEAIDGRLDTWWEAGRGTDGATFTLTFDRLQGLGGLTVDWLPGRAPAEFVVETHGGDYRWRPRLHVTGSRGVRDQIYLPDTQAVEVRLRVAREGAQPAAIREVTAQPLAWSATPEAFQMNVARGARRGLYPRAYLGEPTACAPVGRGDGAAGLLTSDGALEAADGAFTLEPFLVDGDRLVTWDDARVSQSLVNDVLPMPQVSWEARTWRLTVTAAGAGPAGKSYMLARYRVENRGARLDTLRLALAVRPLQAAPRARRDGGGGSTAKVTHLAATGDGRTVLVNDQPAVQALVAPAGFAASTFYGGDIAAAWLEGGQLPPEAEARSELNAASGALWWDLAIEPGGARDVAVALPLRGGAPSTPVDVEAELLLLARAWQATLDKVALRAPRPTGADAVVSAATADEAIRTAKAQAGWLLAGRAGATRGVGLREAALAGETLLRLGLVDEARDQLQWCASRQAENGKLAIDAREVPGATGAFIHLVAANWRVAHDRAQAEAMWPRVVRAVVALESARGTTGADRAYEDDYLHLCGLADAAWLAGELQAAGVKGMAAEARRLASLRDRFGGDLKASLAATMAARGLDYAPWGTNPGDAARDRFAVRDAAAAAMAIDPCAAGALLPDGALERTFDRYWTLFAERRANGDGEGRHDVAPGEMRCLVALARLGHEDRAWDLATWLLARRAVPAWGLWDDGGADFARGVWELAGDHGAD